MKYRKKPVVIDAWPWDKWPEEKRSKHLEDGRVPVGAWVRMMDGKTRFVGTLEGDMHASEGDWLIQGVKGELYACKPDIFDATYEPVESVHKE